MNNYIEIAKNKINNKYFKTLVLGIASGIFLSFAALASTVASAMISNYSMSKMIAAIIFPMGLILIILMKTELFTGNSLMVIPLLDKKVSFKQLLRNWIIVYIGNLIGSVIVALLVSKTPLMSKFGETFISVANTKINNSFMVCFILGILCNFLVCTAVYLATTVSNPLEKIFVIFIPIFLFIILSFEHSVANMFYLSIGYILDNSLTISNLLLKNLFPVTLGNILGGTLLGIMIWYIEKTK